MPRSDHPPARPTRRALALLAAAVLSWGGALAVAAPATAAPSDPAAAATVKVGGVKVVTDFDHDAPFTVRVGSWNTTYSNSVKNTVKGITAVGKKADIIGLQELFNQNRRTAVDKELKKDGWGLVSDAAPQIIYRKSKYSLLADGAVLEIDKSSMENGTGGTSIGPKWLIWAQFKDKDTGGVFFFLNHHIVPGIEVSGGHLKDKAPKRVALYKKQMKVFTATTTTLAPVAPVLGSGDWNFDAQADETSQDSDAPRALLEKAGLWSQWRVLGFDPDPTLNKRYVDYLVATTATVTFTSQTTEGTYGSDHHATTAVASKVPPKG